MSSASSRLAGTAVRWRTMQLAGVQGVYFLRLLLLAQLLAPDAFGLVAIAAVAIGVIARVTNLGMIPALVQRERATLDEYDAAWTAGLLRALGIAIFLTIFAVPVASLFGEPGAASIVQALGWRVVIEAAASIGVARATRDMDFRKLGMIAIPAAAVDLVVAVATARWFGVWALVAGSLAGSACTLVLSYILVPHVPRFNFRLSSIRPLIRYGRWVLVTGIVALVGSSFSQLAISRLEGVGALGLYFLAWRVAFFPIDAASAVISSVAFPMFARLRDDAARTAATFRTLLTGQAVVLVPGYALIFVLAPSLEAMLGERWAGTATIVQILAMCAVTGLLGELVTPLLMGRGRADQAFKLELVQTGVQVAVLLPFVLMWGVRGAALAWLAGNVSALVVTIAWLRSILPDGLALSFKSLFATIAAAAFGAAVASAAAMLPSPAGLFAGAAGGLAAAGVTLIVLDRWLCLNLWELADWIRGAGIDNRAP